MTNCYYDGTGVLVLEAVTPVIEALFGGFELDPTTPGNGEAYIARIAESNDPRWDDIFELLEDVARDLGLALPDEGGEDSNHELLRTLAAHFGVAHEPSFIGIIEHTDFDEQADLAVLFDLARAFDDGHGLKAIKFEGCWHCSKPRLFEFGGAGSYDGRHVSFSNSSSMPLQLGTDVDAALEARDPQKAADRLMQEIDGLLNGVLDDETRQVLRAKLGQSLSAPAGDPENVPVPAAQAIYAGFLNIKGSSIHVDFEAPINATKAETDSAFLDALAQQVTFDYLAVGDSQG